MTGPKSFTVGGSDAAAAIGLDPYTSPAALWAEKTGRMEREQTEAMDWGTRLQPIITDALPIPVDPCDHLSYTDPERDWLIGHPDGLIGDDGIAEVKTASSWLGHEWEDDNAPARYIVQCQVYLYLTMRRFAMLAVLIGGQRLEVREVGRNDELIVAILDGLDVFYGYLRRDECPPFIGTDSDDAVIRHLHPEHVPGKVARCDVGLEQVARDARLWHEARAKADARYKACVQLLQGVMGDAETLVSRADVPVAHWPAVSRTAIDVSRLRAEAPHVARQYDRTTIARRFTLS